MSNIEYIQGTCCTCQENVPCRGLTEQEKAHEQGFDLDHDGPMGIFAGMFEQEPPITQVVGRTAVQALDVVTVEHKFFGQVCEGTGTCPQAAWWEPL